MAPRGYSKDTKQLLDSMMSASNLSLAEQRKLRAACAAGPSAQLQPARRPLPVGRMPKYEDKLKGVPINPRIAQHLPGAVRRSQADILAANGGSMEREQFRGGPQIADRDEQKQRLQNRMTYGTAELPPSSVPRAARSCGMEASNSTKSAEAALRDEIVGEIAERQEFLDQMRAAGCGAEHEQTITGQIAERMDDLRRLEKLELNG